MVHTLRYLLNKWTTWPQWLAAFEVTLLGFTIGLSGGWTSPFLAKLVGPDSELPVTLDASSWIASLTPIGRVAGAIIGAIGVAYLGSKFSLLCTGVPIAFSWVCFMIADCVEWIYAGRLLQGICQGMFFSSFPLYSGEVAHPKIRGAVVSLIINSAAIGFIIGNLMGSLMTLWDFSVISLVPTICFLVSFALLPASPHYLVARDQLDEAAKALVWYQRDIDVKKEMVSLRLFIQAKNTSGFGETLREFVIPRNRKALIMVTLVFVLLQLGGTYSIGTYMETMLRRAGVKTVIDPGMAVAGIGIFSIMGGLLAMYANDKSGRKVVLAGSCFGLTISLGLFGFHHVLLDQGYGTPSLEWLPVVAMIATEFFINLGIGPVPSTIVSEIFSPRTKSFAACTVNMASGLFAFISSKTYQPMIDTMPDQYVFWLYAIVMASLAVYTIVKLPETKGKSLQEIQDMLESK